jgi:glucuronoarabinoxylan endo-1,4-beta-xylanase
MRVRRVAGVVVCLGLLAGQSGAAQITVEQGTEYQTIDGFGGFGPMKVWWDSPPYYNATWINRIVDTLGLTMLRTTVSASFEFTNDNSDPNVFSRATCNISGHVSGEAEGPLGDHFPYYRAMKAALEARGEQLKLIASIWTPPAWMKTNNDIRNGGNLRTNMYDEFAERCVEYVKVIKDSTGIDLYGLSLQNEPAFVESYE